YASITAGFLNTANAGYASVTGGYNNFAAGPFVSIGGGQFSGFSTAYGWRAGGLHTP
ncbi:MAG: hypothetical protein QOJ65_2080, partial [Fimbriimonadaceae bacterium]|nr:hypothetical protein [Fimbriimonadaceae bacterium]